MPAIDDPLASLRASSVVRAWVLPLIVTALPLTTALFLGEVIVIFGGVVVEDVAHGRGLIRLAAGADDRDREVVDAVGQLDRG